MYHHSLSRLIEAYYAHNLNNSNQFKQFEYNLIYNDSVRQYSSSYLLLVRSAESYYGIAISNYYYYDPLKALFSEKTQRKHIIHTDKLLITGRRLGALKDPYGIWSESSIRAHPHSLSTQPQQGIAGKHPSHMIRPHLERTYTALTRNTSN